MWMLCGERVQQKNLSAAFAFAGPLEALVHNFPLEYRVDRFGIRLYSLTRSLAIRAKVVMAAKQFASGWSESAKRPLKDP
jgi:hypothetical protein